jgi:hypothetical protein
LSASYGSAKICKDASKKLRRRWFSASDSLSTSDLKTEGLGSLFSKRKPHVLEADQAGWTIHWADVNVAFSLLIGHLIRLI